MYTLSPKLIQFHQEIKRFAKALFGDEVTDVDRILQSLTSAQEALKSQINKLNDRRDDEMARTINKVHAEVRMIRKTQHDQQHQDQITQVNETHNMYASFIQAQNDKIERLHAENSALRLEAGKQNVLNLVHQICDEVLRNRDFNVQSEHNPPQATMR